jgi:hypothetical protein
MRNPARVRDIGLVVAGCGVAALVGVHAVPDAAESGLAGGVTAAALLPTAVGLIVALVYGGHAARLRRLRAGDDVVARWHVDAGRWAGFLALEEKLRSAGAVENLVEPRAAPEGIEVVVGPRAVMVGADSYDTLTWEPRITGAATRPGPPPCVEIGLYFQSYDASLPSFPRVLRFPVGAGADMAAAKVCAHFAGLAAASPRRDRSGRKQRIGRTVALAVAALGLVALVAGWLLRARDAGDMAEILMILGALLTPTALMVALVAHLVLRRLN